jgi:hypothetical protein
MSTVAAYHMWEPTTWSSTPLHTLLNRLFALLLPAVGLVITIVAAQDLSWGQRIFSSGIRTTGTVVEIHEEHGGKSTSYVVTYAYAPLGSNNTLTRRATVYYDTYQSLRPGAALRVWYFPEDAARSRIDGEAPSPFVWVLLGVMILGVGLHDLPKHWNRPPPSRGMHVSQSSLDYWRRRQRRG